MDDEREREKDGQVCARAAKREGREIRSVELPGKAQRKSLSFLSLCLFPLKMDPLQASIVSDHRRRQITRLKKRGKDRGPSLVTHGEEKKKLIRAVTRHVLYFGQ